MKGSYEFNKTVALGLEYYGSLGQVSQFESYAHQQHQLFLATDLNLAPQWEFNAGLGYGLTNATERLIFKVILGRTFGPGSKAPQPSPLPKPQ